MALDCKVPHRKARKAPKATKSGGTHLHRPAQLCLWRKLLCVPPGSLRKVSCRTVRKHCCFKYRELIFTHRHHNSFTALKMHCKVLLFVSSALVSPALFSFSCREFHAGFCYTTLISCTKSLEFSLLALLRTHSLSHLQATSDIFLYSAPEIICIF